jgi:hypothetical protein
MTTRVIVYHTTYGCDTGCCGHVVTIEDEQGNELEREFDFSHPYGGDKLEYAKDLVEASFSKEHIADLDWDSCIISDD